MKDVREVAERARARLGERGQGTILFLDEVHRFSRAQQDVLLPFVEEGSARARRRDHREPVLLAHRPAALAQHALPPRAARRRRRSRELAHRALDDDERGLGDEPTDDRRRRARASRRQERGRRAPSPHRARGRARARRRRPTATTITLDDAEAALALRSVRYGDDEHYDIISAFIKSIRGSDPDAGLYWLARMLEAGEDARFIARRLVILASEDIGLADPQALLVADAAARAVEYVGLPEAALNLAHAVIHLALAPEVATASIARARRGDGGRPRPPARPGADAPAGRALPRRADARATARATSILTTIRQGWVPQEHLPAEVAGEQFYRPSAARRRAGADRSAGSGADERPSDDDQRDGGGDDVDG